MDQVADDIERQRTLYSTTIQKGSATGQNVSKTLKKIAEQGGHSSAGLISLYLAAKEAYEYIPESLHGAAGVTAAGAALAARHFYVKARNAGLKNSMDIYHDAIEHPDKAADLLSRPNPNRCARLAEKYGRPSHVRGLGWRALYAFEARTIGAGGKTSTSIGLPCSSHACHHRRSA